MKTHFLQHWLSGIVFLQDLTAYKTTVNKVFFDLRTDFHAYLILLHFEVIVDYAMEIYKEISLEKHGEITAVGES